MFKKIKENAKKKMITLIVYIIEVIAEGIDFLLREGILVPIMKATIFVVFIDDLSTNSKVTFASWIPIIFFAAFGLIAFIIKALTAMIVEEEKRKKQEEKKQ